MSERKAVEDLGYWDGLVFRFHEPFIMPGGETVEAIDCRYVSISDDSITPRDMIEAMTDPSAQVGKATDYGSQFAPITLPSRQAVELPPEIAASIEEDRRHGVSFSRPRRGEPRAICWDPGDRNVLAETIIEQVKDPTRLILDGHAFVIGPAGGDSQPLDQ